MRSSISNYSNFSTFLVGSLIFISASPLFENIEKIIFTSAFIFILAYHYQYRFKFSAINSITLVVILTTVVFYGFFLDVLYVGNLDFVSVGFFISIFLGFILSGIISKDQLIYSNERLVHWSLLLGIPIFVILQFFPSIINLAFTYNYGGYLHKTFFVTNIHYTEEDRLSERFVGIGREPGVTQIFLLIALWSRLSKSKKFDFPVILILLGLLLGKSTAGFFSLFIVIFLTIPFRKNLKYFLYGSPIVLFFIIDQLNYHLQNKLTGSVSFLNRYERYISFFSGEWYTILFGFGNSYYAKIIGFSDLGGWDTLLQLSQRYGLTFFIILNLLLFSNNRKHLMVALIICISFFSQLIWFYPVIAFFYFKDKVII